MILTIPPNDFGGRLCLNCALTTPELPAQCQSTTFLVSEAYPQHTMWPRDLAPDDPDLRASYFPLAAIDVCDALAQVE